MSEPSWVDRWLMEKLVGSAAVGPHFQLEVERDVTDGFWRWRVRFASRSGVLIVGTALTAEDAKMQALQSFHAEWRASPEARWV